MVKFKKYGLAGAILIILAAVAATGFLTTTPSSKATAENEAGLDKEAIQQIIREYLVGNPEVLLEAMEALQNNRHEIERRRAAQVVTDQHDRLFNNDATPFAGNPDGDVAIVEFLDYNCGYCRRALQDIVTLLGEDSDIKVLFKEMPILNESSRDAARWALAAHKQGKYFDYHVSLMNSSGPKNVNLFERIGRDLGLDIDRLREDATNNPAIERALEDNRQLAQDLGVRGTPAFIIGETFAPGYMGVSAMRQAIANERNR